jgi:hypothetical protein
MARFRSRLSRPALVAALCACGAIAHAQQPTQSGGVIVRIPHTASHCINGTRDQIYLTLARIIVNKQSGFFKKTVASEIIVNVTVQSATALTFPLSEKVNISDGQVYQNGQVSLPVEYSLVTGLPLTTKAQGTTPGVVYKGLNAQMTVVNTESTTLLSDAIASLATVTGADKTPIPSTPLTEAGSYLLKFANTAINNSIDSHNAGDKLTSDSLKMTFDPGGACVSEGTFEMTGVKAVLWADKDLANQAGYVDIARTNDYCWTADVSPSFVLKATLARPGVACGDASYGPGFKPVANNYYALLLESIPQIEGAGPASAEVTRAFDEISTYCGLLRLKGGPCGS